MAFKAKNTVDAALNAVRGQAHSSYHLTAMVAVEVVSAVAMVNILDYIYLK